ncbi:hypothetical protein IBTHAUMO2_450019 [Nitrosopumilaceae archaeon]|nr:AbrB/MazE/SpoVT family DNA-binding domain-containing protein [Nitrosopumilus sp.]MDA7973720.1 AbrB/MazE/SpoVT family DNA-binding domain-containing protein [Nitrosopumilus sp.]CAI9831813.1 hypothetical protein IBTHAUMO2_450019 [Nitrosopumilaceae archaeon]
MDPKKSYTRVLQWRKPSYILTIPPALVIRMEIKPGQPVVLSERRGVLVGIPGKPGITDREAKTAERHAIDLIEQKAEEDAKAEEEGRDRASGYRL